MKGLNKVGTYASFSTAARDVVVEGNYAYMATYTYGGNYGGVAVLDVSNKSSPTLLGKYFPSSSSYALYASNLVKSGNYVYIDGGSVRNFAKVNVQNPYSPQLVYQLTESDVSPILAIEGNYLYQTSYTKKALRVYDVSDNYSPTLLINYSVPENPWDIVVERPYVFLERGDKKLVILKENGNPPSSFTLEGSYSLAELGCFVKNGNYLYYVLQTNPPVLEIINVSNPAQPTKVSSLTLTKGGTRIKFGQNCIFIASSEGIEYVDVAAPSNPKKIGFLPEPMSANGMSISGDYVYIADGGGGAGKLKIFQMVK
ncbi:MAG: hypothetical protein N2442_07585 [Spirochaetes bacterium]|nr:hypothetical protein [Spirochaetota bacterium]